VISNSPPVLGAVSLSPSAPFTNDTLSALVTDSDPDGDSLSYSYACSSRAGSSHRAPAPA
jgi:hypothetical protein